MSSLQAPCLMSSKPTLRRVPPRGAPISGASSSGNDHLGLETTIPALRTFKVPTYPGIVEV